MAAVNSNALAKFVGTLEVAPYGTASWTRLASVRNLNAIWDTAANTVDVKADDTGSVYQGVKPEVRVEGTFLELFDRDTMLLILGGTDSDVAAAPVAGATQTLSSGSWNYNNFYVIENQMGDGTAVTINSVTGGTDGALTDGDGFHFGQNEAGDYGIYMGDAASELTTETQNIVIDYDYTPNASESLVLSASFQEAQRLALRITATDPSANTRRITLDDCRFEGQYQMGFLDAVEAGDLNGVDFVFIGNDGASLTIYNEVL